MNTIRMALFTFFSDTILALFFLRKIRTVEKRMFVLQPLLLFPVFTVYRFLFPSGLIFLRVVVLVVCYCIYVKLKGEITWKKSLYYSFFVVALIYSLQGFTSRLLRAMGFGSFYLFMAVHLAAITLLYVVVSFLVFMDRREEINAFRFLSAFSCMLLIVLGKRISILSFESTGVILILFDIAFNLIVLSLMVAIDRFFHVQNEKHEAELLNAVNRNELENLKRDIQTREAFASVAHDLKNHIIALSGSSDDEYGEKLLDYLDSMSGSLHTGNNTLDGLIWSKMASINALGINFNVNLDLSVLGYLESIDVVALFGNLLDNAVEAVSKVQDASDRYIFIRNWTYADNMVISFINSRIGKGEEKAGFLASSKPDPDNHGIGMRNIRRTVEKYNGVFSFDNSKDHEFTATVMLPMTV